MLYKKNERKGGKCCNFLCHSTCSGRSDRSHCFTFPSALTAGSILGPDFRSPSTREAGGQAARPRAQRASRRPGPPGGPHRKDATPQGREEPREGPEEDPRPRLQAILITPSSPLHGWRVSAISSASGYRNSPGRPGPAEDGSPGEPRSLALALLLPSRLCAVVPGRVTGASLHQAKGTTPPTHLSWKSPPESLYPLRL